MTTRTWGVAIAVGLIGLSSSLLAQQPAAGGGSPDRVAAVKQSIADGTKKLAQYRVGRDHGH